MSSSARTIEDGPSRALSCSNEDDAPVGQPLRYLVARPDLSDNPPGAPGQW